MLNRPNIHFWIYSTIVLSILTSYYFKWMLCQHYSYFWTTYSKKFSSIFFVFFFFRWLNGINAILWTFVFLYFIPFLRLQSNKCIIIQYTYILKKWLLHITFMAVSKHIKMITYKLKKNYSGLDLVSFTSHVNQIQFKYYFSSKFMGTFNEIKTLKGIFQAQMNRTDNFKFKISP